MSGGKWKIARGKIKILFSPCNFPFPSAHTAGLRMALAVLLWKVSLTLKVSLSVFGEWVLLAYFSHLNIASATFSLGSMFLSSWPNTSKRENPSVPGSSPIRSFTTATTYSGEGRGAGGHSRKAMRVLSEWGSKVTLFSEGLNFTSPHFHLHFPSQPSSLFRLLTDLHPQSFQSDSIGTASAICTKVPRHTYTAIISHLIAVRAASIYVYLYICISTGVDIPLVWLLQHQTQWL